MYTARLCVGARAGFSLDFSCAFSRANRCCRFHSEEGEPPPPASSHERKAAAVWARTSEAVTSGIRLKPLMQTKPNRAPTSYARYDFYLHPQLGRLAGTTPHSWAS